MKLSVMPQNCVVLFLKKEVSVIFKRVFCFAVYGSSVGSARVYLAENQRLLTTQGGKIKTKGFAAFSAKKYKRCTIGRFDYLDQKNLCRAEFTVLQSGRQELFNLNRYFPFQLRLLFHKNCQSFTVPNANIH